jgi:hypothetical protein
VGDNKGDRPANQVDKRFSAVGFIDDIVNHNVEHRFFVYFVFDSPIFRVERTSYYTGCRRRLRKAPLQRRSRPGRDAPGSKGVWLSQLLIAYPTRSVEAAITSS